jgi:DNA-binding transcriptional LysR family regulator
MTDPTAPRRLHFDLTTVQLFIATAESGGVTRGAERVHLAPAAASRRIQELESQCGVALFERRPHGMALTDAGRAMLAHARDIAHTVLRMQDDAASFLGGEQGVVRVAAPRSAVIQFLPRDIERCAAVCPGVRIDLQEMDSQVVQQALRRGVADIGIYEANLGAIGMPQRPYRGDRLCAVARAGHPLARQGHATLDDVLASDLISLGEGSAISLLLGRLAGERGRRLRLRMRVGGFDSIAALVAQGLGLGVMPEAVARAVAGGARFARLPIREDWARRDFVLCHREESSLPRAALAVAQVLAERPAPPAARTRPAKPASPK